MDDNLNQTSSIVATTQKSGVTDIKPNSIQPNMLSSHLIKNTTTLMNGPTSLTNGSGMTVTSVVSSDVGPNIEIASVGYSIAFFVGSIAAGNVIGYTVIGNYNIQGPFLMPPFSPEYSSVQEGGSDGNNLIYNTTIINNTGSTKSIYWITSQRYIQPGGTAS
jgi:hypothetical protein